MISLMTLALIWSRFWRGEPRHRQSLVGSRCPFCTSLVPSLGSAPPSSWFTHSWVKTKFTHTWSEKEQRNVKSGTREAVENNSKQVHLDFHHTVSFLLPTPYKHECTHSIFISHTHRPPCKPSFGEVWIVSKAAFTPNPALQRKPAGQYGGRAHCATASCAVLLRSRSCRLLKGMIGSVTRTAAIKKLSRAQLQSLAVGKITAAEPQGVWLKRNGKCCLLGRSAGFGVNPTQRLSTFTWREKNPDSLCQPD